MVGKIHTKIRPCCSNGEFWYEFCRESRDIYGWFVILKPGYAIVYLCTKLDDSSFSLFSDNIWGPENLKWSHDPDHVPFKGDLSAICWDLI